MSKDLKELEQAIQSKKQDETEFSADNEDSGTAPPKESNDGDVSAEFTALQTRVSEKEAEVDQLRNQIAERNVEFASQLADLKEREDEVALALVELKASQDPPDTKLSSRGDFNTIDHEELIGTPEYADYLLLRIAAERRDRSEPGYSKGLFARITAEEKAAGSLHGYRIPGLSA